MIETDGYTIDGVLVSYHKVEPVLKQAKSKQVSNCISTSCQLQSQIKIKAKSYTCDDNDEDKEEGEEKEEEEEENNNNKTDGCI